MTNPELVAHLIKQGGRVLVVGGETADLPRAYQEHAQILIWDDDRINILNREIPSNTKVIIWSRWISHTMVARLNIAAKQLHAIKFPMLRPREIKLLLSEIIQSEPADAEVLPMETLEKEIENIIPLLDMNEEVKDTIVAKQHVKVEMGALQQFYAKHLDIHRDYTVKGSKVGEAKRLFEIANREGVKTTLASLANGLGVFIKRLDKGRATPPKVKTIHVTKSGEVKQPSMNDDFEELERLISDAIVAMKLVQEHLPKVRKETEKLRGLKQKFLRLLE